MVIQLLFFENTINTVGGKALLHFVSIVPLQNNFHFHDRDASVIGLTNPSVTITSFFEAPPFNTGSFRKEYTLFQNNKQQFISQDFHYEADFKRCYRYLQKQAPSTISGSACASYYGVCGHALGVTICLRPCGSFFSALVSHG